ncbi:MAG: glycosyltransferase [Pseudomonadota bacterium]|nr:glycosyltransferase [Pseudomonadota bacterium]
MNALSARRGGIVTYTRNLMNSFREQSINAVFALPLDSPLQSEDVETICLPIGSMAPVARAIWEQTFWRRIVSRRKPDILYSSANFGLIRSPVPQLLLVREGGLFDPVYLANIAPVLGARSVIERILRRRLIIASARSSNMVLTPTGAMADLLQDWAPDLIGQVQTNSYGTRLDHFASARKRRKWREDGVLRILLVSAYYSHKQPGLVSEAVQRLNELGIKTHFTLTMDFQQVNQAPGGYKDAFLLRHGADRGEVTMLGHVNYDDLPGLYAKNDLFVTPSLSETFGHPLIEAMASETLTVASDTPVHREVCQDAAAYFSGNSANNLVEVIRALDIDPRRREMMLARARDISTRDYGWDGHVKRLLEKFEIIAAGRAC